MSKRKYTKINHLETEIIKLREEGRTRQEIANELGLTKEQIKGWINRYNHRQMENSVGEIPKKKGRPRKKPLDNAEAYEREIARLEMENKLLRDFLQSIGRK